MFSACSKDEQSDSKSKRDCGFVRDYGDLKTDGCGWLIEMASGIYRPINLSNDYKISGRKLCFTYLSTDKGFLCGLQGDYYEEISITDYH